jgi:hypothetical protein
LSLPQKLGMKKFLWLFLVIGAPSFSASAQERFNLDHFLKNVGKKVTLCDTVSSFKILNDTVTMLNMGGKYPNQKFTVVITGKEIQLNYDTIVGKDICVTGDASLYKNRPEVMIYHNNQIDFK